MTKTTWVSQHTKHTIEDDDTARETAAGRGMFINDAATWLTPDARGTYQGKTVYHMYSVFIYLGSKDLFVFSAEGKLRKKYPFIEYAETWGEQDVLGETLKYSDLFKNF